MKQTNLLKTFLLLCALIVGSTCAWADDDPELTLDFTTAWTAGDANSDGEKVFTTTVNETPYTISGKGTNFKFNSGYFYFGKTNAYIKLPQVDFDVEKIEVVGNSGASAGVKHNIFVGSTAVSTEVTGLNGTTSTFEIGSSYQAANTQYILKVTSNHNAQITYVKYYKKTSSAPVSVTGVSVDPTSWEMAVGDTKTLTATVLPSNASDKSVTWESDNDAVATVSDAGVVTAVAAGTATITVTTTDGSKTATCEITVNPAPAVAATLDFTDTAWGFPNDYTKTEGTYTNGGYTIVVGATAADGHKALKLTVGEVTTQVGLIFGKNGAQVTLPTFDFNVNKIKVYGRSGAATGVKFNIFVGDEAVSTEATGSHVDHEFEIAADKQTAGTEYVLKLTTTDKNCQISKIEIIGYESTPAVSAAGWATYVTKNPVRFTEGEAFAVTSVGSSVGLTAVTDVPKGEPVLLKGAGAKTAEVLESAAAIENKLAISDGSNGVNDYVLANHGGKVGFYKWTGSALASGKVYLPASEVAGARDFIGFDETTGIANINSDAKTLFNGDFFNLAGQRVANPTKGLYIVNGRKVVVK